VRDPVLRPNGKLPVAFALDYGGDLPVLREDHPGVDANAADLAEVARGGLVLGVAKAGCDEAVAARLAHQLTNPPPASIALGEAESRIVGEVERHGLRSSSFFRGWQRYQGRSGQQYAGGRARPTWQRFV